MDIYSGAMLKTAADAKINIYFLIVIFKYWESKEICKVYIYISYEIC